MLIVEAISLGLLSIPSAFATFSILVAVIYCVGIGLTVIYTYYAIRQVKLAFPSVYHYSDAKTLLICRFRYGLFSSMFLL